MTKRLTIKEAEDRHPDMIKGQRWRLSATKYSYYCKIHGVYKQTFNMHNRGSGCSKCGNIRTSKILSLTIMEAEKRQPDIVKGQKWRGVDTKYEYHCEKHGIYLQTFSHRKISHGCQKCAIMAGIIHHQTADGLARTPEYMTIRNHFEFIFNPKNPQHRSYRGMPFFDGWNPKKGGTMLAGAKWIIANLGKRPEECSLHIVNHEKGFVPDNLEWTYRKKQNAEQMFKIIADLRHEIKKLKRQLESREKA